ncbi:phage scaffolding protein [Leuconostocaceae bacterium ESL0958]|nr:phage scaffolding protein [Leuconostocaceae bacterium ESL0958]
MKREELRELGLNEEQVEAVMKQHHVEIGNANESAEKLSATETERDQLQEQLKERDKDLAKLKKQSKDNEELSTQIAELTTKYDESSKQWESEKAQMKLDAAVDSVLSQTKARDKDVLKQLLNVDTLKLTDDGKVDGLDDQIKQLETDKPFLFEGEKAQGGYKPTEGNDSTKDSFGAALGLIKPE